MKNFKPTEGQAEALRAIQGLGKKFPGGGAVVVISGFAGTGKTAMLKVLADENPNTFVLTPTGKASVRVREAAGCRAMTIHKYLYKVEENEETGELSFYGKNSEEIETPANKTLIIDEASMVGRKTFEDLKFLASALGLNIVFIGDGFQLPPVETEGKAFSVFDEDIRADIRVNLKEVLRQALESPIIRISTSIRDSADLLDVILDIERVDNKDLDSEIESTNARGGMILCHRNKTRHDINNKIRALRGLPEGKLIGGEPLLVRQNNYKLDVFNGEVHGIRELGQTRGPLPVRDRNLGVTQYMEFNAIVFNSTVEALISPEEIFGKLPEGFMRTPIRKASRRVLDSETEKHISYVHANLGYACTCHSFQGSEVDEVLLVMEPSIRLNTLEGRRYLYTALTRSRTKVRACWL